MKRKFFIGIFLYFSLFVCSKSWATTKEIQLILTGAAQQTHQTKIYDPAYVAISYPGGDVPMERGVCADVVIRAFRHAGVDLQRSVHEDMRKAFGQYPKVWGLKSPDQNIDHRRVLNLMMFFKRKGKSLPITADAKDYIPGDVVAWRLSNGLYHIGLISDRTSFWDSKRFLVVHNIGAGAQFEDFLFGAEIVGHYRYF